MCRTKQRNHQEIRLYLFLRRLSCLRSHSLVCSLFPVLTGKHSFVVPPIWRQVVTLNKELQKKELHADFIPQFVNKFVSYDI